MDQYKLWNQIHNWMVEYGNRKRWRKVVIDHYALITNGVQVSVSVLPRNGIDATTKTIDIPYTELCNVESDWLTFQ